MEFGTCSHSRPESSQSRAALLLSRLELSSRLVFTDDQFSVMLDEENRIYRYETTRPWYMNQSTGGTLPRRRE